MGRMIYSIWGKDGLTFGRTATAGRLEMREKVSGILTKIVCAMKLRHSYPTPSILAE